MEREDKEKGYRKLRVGSFFFLLFVDMIEAAIAGEKCCERKENR